MDTNMTTGIKNIWFGIWTGTIEGSWVGDARENAALHLESERITLRLHFVWGKPSAVKEKRYWRKGWKSSGVRVYLTGGGRVERGLISVSSKCSAHRQCVTVHRVDVWIQECEAGVWSLMRRYQSSGFFCEFWVTHERDSVIKHNPKQSLHRAQPHVWFRDRKRRRGFRDERKTGRDVQMPSCSFQWITSTSTIIIKDCATFITR